MDARVWAKASMHLGSVVSVALIATYRNVIVSYELKLSGTDRLV